MQNSNWEIEAYPLSDFKNEFNSLSLPAQNEIEQLLRELVVLTDPEDNDCAVDCPKLPGFNNAVKYVTPNGTILIVALERIELGTHNTYTIVLFSCSE